MEVISIQYLGVLRVCVDGEVECQRIKEKLLQEGKTLKEEDIIKNMIGLSLIIVMEDHSQRMVEQVIFIESIPNKGWYTATLIKVNQEIEVNKQSCPVKNKEKTIFLDVLCVHVAIVKGED